MMSTDDGNEEDETPFMPVSQLKRKHRASTKKPTGKKQPRKKMHSQLGHASTSHQIPLSQASVVLTPLSADVLLQTTQFTTPSTQPTNKPTTTTSTKNNIQPTIPRQNPPTTSKRMQEIIRPTFTFAYFLQTLEGTTRLNIADAWSSLTPSTRDDIIQTSRGFILKTNTDPAITGPLLLQMVANKAIQNFAETNTNKVKQTPSTPSLTYSVVVHSVEPEISDLELSNHLNKIGLQHRFCKRIISRATNRPTRMMRVITGEVATFETLLGEGIYYRCRHYAVEPSRAPAPTPTPCAKCSLYTHTTAQCTTPTKCLKCGDAHATPLCTNFRSRMKCASGEMCSVPG